MKLPIILCEGIGDSLLLLGFIPHQFLARLGLRFNAFYISPSDNNKHYRLAGGLVRDLILAVPHFSLQERAPTPAESRLFQIMIRLFRRRVIYDLSGQPKTFAARLWHWAQGLAGFKPFYPTRLDSEKAKSLFGAAPNGRLRLLFHTHLDTGFAPFKSYGAEGWMEVIKRLLERNPGNPPEIWILEFNQEAAAQIRARFPEVRVLNESLGSFSSIVSSFEYFDVLVAVDSWTKYVGNWYGLETVVIVPSHINKNIWADLHAEHLLNWYFNGLYGAKNIDVLGIEIADGIPRYSLENIRDLPAAVLVDRIQAGIDRRKNQANKRSF